MKEFSEQREDNRRMFDDNARLVVDNKNICLLFVRMLPVRMTRFPLEKIRVGPNLLTRTRK